MNGECIQGLVHTDVVELLLKVRFSNRSGIEGGPYAFEKRMGIDA